MNVKADVSLTPVQIHIMLQKGYDVFTLRYQLYATSCDYKAHGVNWSLEQPSQMKNMPLTQKMDQVYNGL